MSLGSAIVLILQLHQLQGPAGFYNILSFEELTLEQRQWPQESWVVLSSNRARETCRTSNRNKRRARTDTARPQGHWNFLAVWHLPLSQFSHYLNLKLLSVSWRLTCGSWNSFSVPLPSELYWFKVLFSVFYSWSPKLGNHDRWLDLVCCESWAFALESRTHALPRFLP